MSWFILAITALIWIVILVSCLPTFWPSAIHDMIEGHAKLVPSSIRFTRLMKTGGMKIPIDGPAALHLMDAFNKASFMKQTPIPLRSETHLLFELDRGHSIAVYAGKSDGDLYIVRRKGARTKKAYWAKQTELFRFITNQLWLVHTVSSGVPHRRAPRGSHLRRVR